MTSPIAGTSMSGDGIHVNVRLENEANQRQCLLVLMGATADELKDLIAVVDGYRESEQSWHELLLGLKHRGLALAPKLAIGDGALGFSATRDYCKHRSHLSQDSPRPKTGDTGNLWVIERLVVRLRLPDKRPMQRVTVNDVEHGDFDAAADIIRLKTGAGRLRVRAYY